MQNSLLHVNKLRVRNYKGDPLSIRLQLANLLNTGEFHPPGIPPTAILVVRRLVDPLPGRLVSTRQAVRVDVAWETAVRHSLENLYRQAAQPQQGIIAGEPEAVLFADEAEMLACLLLARQRGLSSLAWWQRSLGDRPGSATTLIARLAQKPILIPAVLMYLTQWRAAEKVLARFPPQQALTLLQAVVDQYHLTGLQPIQSDPHPAASTSAQQSPSNQRSLTDDQRPLPLELPPWSGLVSTPVSPGLKPEQQALWGLCLTLQTRPAAVRTPAFRRGWQRWGQQVTAPATARSLGTDNRPDNSVSASSGQDVVARAQAGEIICAARPVTTAMIRPAPDDQDDTTHRTAPDSLPPDVEIPTSRPIMAPELNKSTLATSTPPKPDSRENIKTAEIVPPPPPTAAIAEPVVAPHGPPVDLLLSDTELPERISSPGVALESNILSWATVGVETAVGGVLYLLNLMRVLNLPEVCEPGWGLAGQVGAWGTLELLGRALLGTAGANHAADPLWSVLAELDGRSPQSLPGADYKMAGDGSLPAGWAATAGTWSPNDSPLLHDVNNDLRRWLSLAVPTMQRRLQQALHLTAVATLPDVLLLASGRLFVTRTHVDLVLSLETISLPLRRVGLDANPGWLPAFGRIVTFHFQ